MKIKCDCGELVAVGIIGDKNRFNLNGKPSGTILKNKSNNPNNWNGLCSKCQSKKYRKKKQEV